MAAGYKYAKYVEDKYFVQYQGAFPETPILKYSTDGSGWNNCTGHPNTVLIDMVHGLGMYAGISSSGVYGSNNGIDWVLKTGSTPFKRGTSSAQLYTITFDGSKFIIVSRTSDDNRSTIWTSTDLISWTEVQTSSQYYDWSGLGWDGYYYCLIGEDGWNFKYSTDLNLAVGSWQTFQPLGTNTRAIKQAFGNSKHVILGDGLATTHDMNNWTKVGGAWWPSSNGTIVYDDYRDSFYALMRDPSNNMWNVFKSEDGLTWSLMYGINSTDAINASGIAAGPEAIVIVYENGGTVELPVISTDGGQTWQSDALLPKATTPAIPTAIDIGAEYITWQSDAGSRIVCNSEDKVSPATFTGLTPNTVYEAYAYRPADGTYSRSDNSDGASAITVEAKTPRSAPTPPIASSITSSSLIWSSEPGSIIKCNGQEKPTGSSWTGLTRNTTYTAVAYFPEDDTYAISPDSTQTSVNTLAELPELDVGTPQYLGTNSSGPIGCVVEDNGGDTLIETGMIWHTSSADILTSGTKIPDNGIYSSYLITINGLLPGTTYYYAAYATNSAGTGFSTVKSLTTLNLTPYPTPNIPVASNITATSFVLTSSAGATIVCNGEEKATGSTWEGLTPSTDYTAYAYRQADANNGRSSNSQTVTIRTANGKYPTPDVPVASEITARTIKWTSTNGSKIVCNGEEKDSGSTWVWLNPNTTYAAYAYIPGDSTLNRSDNSQSGSAQTTGETTAPQTVNLSGIMSDGSKAPTAIIQSTKITASNDNVLIKDNQILLVKKGTTQITFENDGKTTTMDINIV